MNEMTSPAHRSSPRRHVHLAFLLIILFVSQGCYHYRVTVPQPNPATEYEQRTAHVLFWGLLQQDTPASDCVSNALDEVVATTNLGYLVISVATLGIWVPMQVKWRCGKEPLQEGDPIGQWRGQAGFDGMATGARLVGDPIRPVP